MTESLDELRIQDEVVAWEVAYAEKPGRDYLHDNPDLPRNQVIAVSYEIGRAAMYAEQVMTPSYLRDPYVPPYEYRSVPPRSKELPKLEESPLIAEWAKIPGIKLIAGRPVVSEADMRSFGNQQISSRAAIYKRGWGARVWGALCRGVQTSMRYAPGTPEYPMQQTLDAIQYFDEDTAQQAGLEVIEHVGRNQFSAPTEYLDLYSLYRTLPELRRLVEDRAARPSGFGGFGPESVSFLESFLAETLRLEALPSAE
jgi:hypothetical protein